MRIVFISAGNLYLCPYIKKYLTVIGEKVSYDIIFWNRHGVLESTYAAENIYQYTESMDELVQRWRKLTKYLGFGAFCKKILKKNNYNRVILLHTNCGVLLYSVLKRHYYKRFVLDIRDYTMERNPLYYALEKGVIKAAAVCFISSNGYQSFLPKAEYHMVHNNAYIPNKLIFRIKKNRGLNKPIRISFIGLIRFFEQSEKMANLFFNDPRFCLNFFGKNAKKLECYLSEKGYCSGMNFLDQFPQEKTLELYEETDIINGAYGNGSFSLDYAYSNKLYYSASLGLPILVSPGTAMEKIVMQYGLGFVFDPDDSDIVGKLYQYYRNINWVEFDKNCEVFLKLVAEDDKKFEGILKELIQV